ncbi:MAG: anaerobic ribonucleoside-triphosphate reductase activating protein [Cetobacterium sp.]
MRVISENKNDAVNSVSGFTYSIFFSGCSHRCEGCFSPQTWGYENGTSVSFDELIKRVKLSRHKNISLIGGDPLFCRNREEVIRLIKWIKENTDKKVYVWTGYLADEVSKWIDLELIDYLIDGKFEITKRDIRLVLRGSSNQSVYKNGVNITTTL